ncbi:MAG: cytochrome b [Pseudomonadota bacterium]
MSDTPATYTLPARLLHWATAIAVIAAIPLAVMAEYAAPPDKGALFFWHKSFGVLVFAIVALRMAHRLIFGVPSPHPKLTPFERTASWAVHVTLYALLLIIPLLGWWGSSAFGRPPSFFGLFTLPALTAENPALGEQIMDVHVILAFAFGALVLGHILFAVYHAVMRKDGILSRMVTGH